MASYPGSEERAWVHVWKEEMTLEVRLGNKELSNLRVVPSQATKMSLRKPDPLYAHSYTVKTFWLLRPYFGHLSCMPDVRVTHYKTSKDASCLNQSLSVHS